MLYIETCKALIYEGKMCTLFSDHTCYYLTIANEFYLHGTTELHALWIWNILSEYFHAPLASLALHITLSGLVWHNPTCQVIPLQLLAVAFHIIGAIDHVSWQFGQFSYIPPKADSDWNEKVLWLWIGNYIFLPCMSQMLPI